MTKDEIESKNVELLLGGPQGYLISFSSPEPDKIIKQYNYHFRNNKLCSISGSFNVKFTKSQEINTLFHNILNKIRNKFGEPYTVD
ncbi:hypothetical protein DM558_01125 [Entomomonas moraniae]|uniref:Uncharacterized protein n=1 Tax=Entomomonas moraniae TaxID=2213226 RepID=A0A3Q9JH63_9GAMM|nr:hypothetical protein [Entomomonas moraniae]AZS49461.1 hypothetical protein DM558_01125 [Entomomonas moraniae]